jgi:hypothetical protein
MAKYRIRIDKYANGVNLIVLERKWFFWWFSLAIYPSLKAAQAAKDHYEMDYIIKTEVIE